MSTASWGAARVRVASPRPSACACRGLESGGIRAPRLLLLRRPAGLLSGSRREGGGTQAESRRTETRTRTTSSSSIGGRPHHVLQPEALHPLLSQRHPEPDGGLPEVRRHGARRGEPRVPAASLPARYAAAAPPPPPPPAASSPSPPPSPPPVLVFILLLFLSSRRALPPPPSPPRAPRGPPRGSAVLRGRGGVLQRGRPAVLPGAGSERRGGVVRSPGAPVPHNLQVPGPVLRDEPARAGGQPVRPGQVSGAAARGGGGAQEAARALLAGAGVRAGAALQAAEVPVRPGARAPGRAHPPEPEPGEDLVPEPPLQAEAAGQGQAAAAAAGRVRGGGGAPGRVPAARCQDREGLPERLQRRRRLGPHREPAGQLGGGRGGGPAAAAGEPDVLHRRAGGLVPESAAAAARAAPRHADGRGAPRVRQQHDRLRVTVREDLVGPPGRKAGTGERATGGPGTLLPRVGCLL